MKRALKTTVLLVLAGAAATSAQDGKNYGGASDELVPHRGSGEPCRRFFQEPPIFRGPHDEPPPVGDAVTIGVIAPLTGEDAERGRWMQEGVQLAIDEANAAGGFRGKAPYRTVVRDENLTWGAAGNAAVDLAFDEGARAFIGALEDSASHVMTRVILKLETPMINVAGTDPTLTEHNIPWLIRMRPDDRQTGYALAQRLIETDHRERIAVFRSNDRYARAGIAKFNDSARRLKHPVLVEERFEASDASWDAQIARLAAAKPDAIVVWGRAKTAGRAVKALRAAGLRQPVYGPERLAEEPFVAAAGDAAEGAVYAFPFDTRRADARWTSFVARYQARFGREPDPTASYAYDGTRFLLDSIAEVGLSRAAIRDRLFAPATYDGVTGPVKFDTTRNNVTPSIFGRIKGGRAVLE